MQNEPGKGMPTALIGPDCPVVGQHDGDVALPGKQGASDLDFVLGGKADLLDGDVQERTTKCYAVRTSQTGSSLM